MSWRDALIDAGIAYLIGILASAAVLLLLAAIQPGMSFYEIAGKIAVQAVPAGMGAVLAHSQLGMREGKRRPTGGGRATPAPLARVGATPSWRAPRCRRCPEGHHHAPDSQHRTTKAGTLT